jgi:hypothetical protein
MIRTADREEEANKLAQAHYLIEEGLTRVLRIKGDASEGYDPNDPIMLLEVNENTVASGVMPIRFGPVPEAGFHFPSIIVEVTPVEFHKIENNELPLPEGWELGPEIPRFVESVQ